MKKLFLLFLAPLAASTVNIGGEALYLKPCGPAFNYSIGTTETTVTPTTVNVLTPQYEMGYRLYGNISWCRDDFELGITYTSYDNTTAAKAKGNVFVPLIPRDDPFERVKARVRFHYRTTEVRGNFLIYRCNWMLFKLVGGIDYLRFRRFRQVFALAQDYYEEIHFDGVGPELGFQLDSCSLGGLRCHVLFTTTALFGENRLRTELDRAVLTQAPRHSYCLPAFYLKVGVSYTLPLGGLSVSGELGYEMHNYMQLIRTATTVTRGATTFFFTGRDNFGLWGPYGRIEVSF